MPTENSSNNNNKQIIIKIIYFCRKRRIVHGKCVCMCAFICESVNVHVDMYMCVRTVLVFILMLTSILTLKWKTIHNIHPHQPANNSSNNNNNCYYYYIASYSNRTSKSQKKHLFLLLPSSASTCCRWWLKYNTLCNWNMFALLAKPGLLNISNVITYFIDWQSSVNFW